MRTLISALLLSTVASAAQAEPIKVGSPVAHYTTAHVFVCFSHEDVVAARKHRDLVKGCAAVTPDQFGIVIALDGKSGVMKIELDDDRTLGKAGPQVFTTLSGWFATKIEE